MDLQPQLNTEAIKTENRSTRLLAGVGIIALILVAVWLGVQAVQLGGNITSGLASGLSGIRSLFGSNQNLVVTVNPSTIVTDKTILLSWEQDNIEIEGNYTFSYECINGITFTSEQSENTGGAIFCNTGFDFENTDNNLVLVAVSTNEEPTDIELRVHFTPVSLGGDTVEGNTTVTVVPDASFLIEADTGPEIAGDNTEKDEEARVENDTTPTPITNPTPTVVTTIVGPANDPNGTPDLVVRILSVGTVTTSGTFTEVIGALDPSKRLAVKFEIENIGTKETGPWSFEAELPTEPRYDYDSPTQETLMPGVTVEYILGFEDAEDDDETIRIEINVDEKEKVEESNENNNSDSITVDILS